MATTKKIDKTFQLSDSSINVYGFRLLTSGYLKDEYKKNPIGYYMHNREDGVILMWDNVRIEGDAILAEPVINLSNPKGQQCANEIADGFLKGASVGHIVALKWSEDPKDMLPGQTGPTITEWYNRECSVCDVPGNMNSLALYDKDGNEIKLSDFKTQKTILDMKEIKLNAAQLAKINLTDAATEAEVNTKLDGLVADAGKVPQLTADLATANTAKKKAEDDLAALKGETVNDLIDTAVKETRCTKEGGEMLKTQYAGKPTEVKSLLATMKPYPPATNNLTDDAKAEVAELMKLSGEKLFQEGKFDRLKALSAEGYKVKYKEYFGGEPPADEKK